MLYLPSVARWQVDTGPIVFHDLIRHSPDGPSAEGLHLAFIAFNRLDSVDVILEADKGVGHGMRVVDYSERRSLAANVRLFASQGRLVATSALHMCSMASGMHAS